MADNIQVEMVAADRVVWSGEARMVITRTVEGEIGILAHHEPTLGVLAPGTVEIRTENDKDLVAAVDGGFLSVANNRVAVLAEHVQLSGDIDLQGARQELERAEQEGDGSEEANRKIAIARARVTAAERASK